VQSEK